MALPLQIPIGYIFIIVLYRRLVCIIIARGVWPGDEASIITASIVLAPPLKLKHLSLLSCTCLAAGPSLD